MYIVLSWSLWLGCAPRGLSADAGECSPVLPLERTGTAWSFDYHHPEEEVWWGELDQVAGGAEERDGVEVVALEESWWIEHQWDGRDEVEQVAWLQCQEDGWHRLGSEGTHRSWGKSGSKYLSHPVRRYLDPPLVAPAAFEVGDTWTVDLSHETTIGDEVYTIEESQTFEVTGVDRIEVPSGSWRAFVVEVHEVPGEGWTEFWVEDVGVVQGRYTTLRSFE